MQYLKKLSESFYGFKDFVFPYCLFVTYRINNIAPTTQTMQMKIIAW